MTGLSPLRRAGGSRSALRESMRGFLAEGEDEPVDWRSITTRDGLPHNWIYDLFQDSGGRIWVGTWGGGVARFEGGRWRTFTRSDGLPSNAVTCVREAVDGTIWVATDAGLCTFDGARFVPAGLRGKSILSILFDSDGHLWAGCWRAATSGGGLFRFDGVRWANVSQDAAVPGVEILKVFEDSRRNIWVGTYDQGHGAGVGCFDGRRWRGYTAKDGLADDCVYSMFEDPDGRMWFGTTGGISVYDGRTWDRLTTMDGLADDRVYAMMIDSTRKMWFGTEGGVTRYDGTNWRTFTKSDGLVENLVRTVIEDRDGGIWVGTYPYRRGRGGISVAEGAARSDAESLLRHLPAGPDQQGLPG